MIFLKSVSHVLRGGAASPSAPLQASALIMDIFRPKRGLAIVGFNQGQVHNCVQNVEKIQVFRY